MRLSGIFKTTVQMMAVVTTSVIALTSGAWAEVGATWDEIVAKAKEEGRVNFYSIMPPAQNEALVEAFSKEYPEIKVVTVRGAGELPGRVAAEKAAGADGADVISLADPAWFTENQADFIELKGPAIDAYPKDHWIVEPKVANISYGPLGFIVWNTDRLPEGLKSWDDLLDPKLKGKVGAREGMTATLAGYLEFLRDAIGEEKFAALGKQDLRFYPSTVPLTQAVAAGEVWAGSSGNIATLLQLVDQGAPIDYVYPEPSFANPQAGGALNYSKRPNAAIVFMDFALSRAGQTAVNHHQLGGSPLEGIEDSVPLERFKILDPTRFTQAVRDEWQVIFDKTMRP